MIEFKFNEEKTTQAALLFLEKNNKSMNYMKLIKLLYLADRYALIHWERPLTGDNYVSMPLGPVVSQTYDMIKSKHYPYWSKHITYPSHYEVQIKEGLPELGKLSKAETELIDNLSTEHKNRNQYELKDYCHDECGEWEEIESGSKPIHIETILKEGNKTDEDIKRIKHEVTSLNYVNEMLSN